MTYEGVTKPKIWQKNWKK